MTTKRKKQIKKKGNDRKITKEKTTEEVNKK